MDIFGPWVGINKEHCGPRIRENNVKFRGKTRYILSPGSVNTRQFLGPGSEKNKERFFGRKEGAELSVGQRSYSAPQRRVSKSGSTISK